MDFDSLVDAWIQASVWALKCLAILAALWVFAVLIYVVLST